MQFKCSSCEKEPINKININRVIDKLDIYLNNNDFDNAVKHLDYWYIESINNTDYESKKSILNEYIGLSRRINNKDLGISKIKELLSIIENNDNTINKAIYFTNIATTYSFFNEKELSNIYYKKSLDIYNLLNINDTYDYASLLNNYGTLLNDLKEYEKSIEYTKKSIDILDKLSIHNDDIALSYINLAHTLYEYKEDEIDLIENYLDKSWEYISSPTIKHDLKYIYTLNKIIPSYKYFKRDLEAKSLEEVIKDIKGI